MGDRRFHLHYLRVQRALDPAAEVHVLSDDEVIAALAGASLEADRYWSNVLATEALNRLQRKNRSLDAAQLHQILVDSVTEYAIFAIDVEGRVASWNSGGERLTGYSSGEVLGRHFRRFFPPEDQERRIPEEEMRQASSEGRFSTKAWRVRKDGSRYLAHVSVFAIHDASGTLRGFAKVQRDLSHDRSVEESLRARIRQQQEVARLGLVALRERDVQIVLDDAVETVARTLDVEYAKVLELLPSGKELLLRSGVGWQSGLAGHAKVSTGADSQAGYTLGSASPVIVEDLREETRFSGPPLLLDHGVVSGMSVVIEGGAGEPPYGVLGTHTMSHRIFTEDDIHFIQAVANVVADTIRRSRYEREIERLNAELNRRVAARTRALEDANRELEAFTYTVSHDLRAPLRGIEYLSRLLTEEEGLPEDELREYARRLRGESSRLTGLVDDLLRMSRATSGSVRRERVDLSAIAKSVLEDLADGERARNVRIHVEEGLEAHADPRLVRVVLENLLGNAWKYTGHTPDAFIAVERREEDGERIYVVRDNGVGFESAAAKQIFTPFQRAHGRDFEGTGIGLASVKRIVNRHGGRVWASSAPGDGARFFFTLGDHESQYESGDASGLM